LDACKARIRAMRGAATVELQSEVDLLEKEFSAACEEAILDMKSFIQYVHDFVILNF
jgi:hypothetical protein